MGVDATLIVLITAFLFLLDPLDNFPESRGERIRLEVEDLNKDGAIVDPSIYSSSWHFVRRRNGPPSNLSTRFAGPPGTYDLDLKIAPGSDSSFEGPKIKAGDRTYDFDGWITGSFYRKRRVMNNVPLKNGDTINIKLVAGLNLDYLELTPSTNIHFQRDDIVFLDRPHRVLKYINWKWTISFLAIEIFLVVALRFLCLGLCGISPGTSMAGYGIRYQHTLNDPPGLLRLFTLYIGMIVQIFVKLLRMNSPAINELVSDAQNGIEEAFIPITNQDVAKINNL